MSAEKRKEQYRVKKAKKPIDWQVTVPGSKSMTNRALLMAALSEGSVTLDGVLFSDDSRYFLSSLKSLGFSIRTEEAKKRVTVEGAGGTIPKKEAEIYVGSAGTAARFLTAMLGCSDGNYVINASEQMKKRPMKPLFDLLIGVGAKISYLEEEGFLPVKITGRGAKNKKSSSFEPKETEIELDISKSTQFLSAMLLVSPMFPNGLRITVTSEKTDGSYIRITRKMMEEAGVNVFFDGRTYRVSRPSADSSATGAEVDKNGRIVYRKTFWQIEPDMSAACYFYGAAAITGGRALVRHVRSDNTQGDLKFLDVLEQIGCTVTDTPEGIALQGPKGGNLAGITVNMNDFSDQTMTLAAMAPFASGPVRITGIGHIRLQESDRIHGIVTELTKLGIRCVEEPDALTVYPGTPGPGCVETYDDHRMAMAFSLIGLRAEGIVINDPSCCKKTFEEYFEVLTALCQE